VNDVETGFLTSGSTGTPVCWLRTTEQLAAETRLLAVLCASDGIDGVVSYAPRQHLYGHLMGITLPALLGVPVRAANLLDAPADLFAGLRRPLVAALPATFAQLARAGTALARLDRLVVVHSSAALPGTAAAVLAGLPVETRFVELFGSTETGLVATRTAPGTTPWTLAPDVTFAGGMGSAATPLTVHSPRLARLPDRSRPLRWRMDDVVSITGPRSFRWLSRRGELVKVNGRRVELDDVLARLAPAAPGVRLSARAHRDALRGEWFTVLAHTTDPAVLTAVRDRSGALPAWQQPHAVEATGSEEM
jgi:acyl-CoA synthetase (AMP-forming)/AMP-acid ligase II